MAILRELEISGFMIDETLDTSMSSAGKLKKKTQWQSRKGHEMKGIIVNYEKTNE